MILWAWVTWDILIVLLQGHLAQQLDMLQEVPLRELRGADTLMTWHLEAAPECDVVPLLPSGHACVVMLPPQQPTSLHALAACPMPHLVLQTKGIFKTGETGGAAVMR